METNARLKKLLETATHPTATDGERINALNAFRRISERVGGFETIFAASAGMEVYHELERTRRAFEVLQTEHRLLKTEYQALLLRNKASREPIAPLGPSYLKKSENIVLAALSKEWQELHRVHEKAKLSGYSETSAATLSYLDALCSTGKAVRREPGFYAGSQGQKVQQAQTWRLKAKFGPCI